MSPEGILYDAELPIPTEWAKRHQGEVIRVRYVMDLEDLINVEFVEGMNDYLDAVSGVVLQDISYSIAQPGPGDDLGPDCLLIEATGELA